VNCWSCQVANPSTAKFCFNCGSRLVADPATEAPCRNCAAPLPIDARFCGNCGTPDPVAQPAAAAPAMGREPAPSAEGLADLLEPAPPDAVAAPEGSDAAALAYDHEEEDEATILR
jgi:ribosomal protein L40E